MPGACYALLVATSSRNKRQTVEALATGTDGTVQAEVVTSLSKPNPLNGILYGMERAIGLT